VPVLAGSSAYALAEAMQWEAGLSRSPNEARQFYATIVGGTVIGVGINFINIDPIKALFWSAVINGVAAVPLMVVMMIMTMQSKVMGRFTLPRWLWAIGWVSTAAMAFAVVTMLATWGD
jgi:Mn2+/Fe2+ NRAMP family transporter